jgi:hypothetical protein
LLLVQMYFNTSHFDMSSLVRVSLPIPRRPQ